MFNVELPLCWDLEGGRKEGRRWKEGREEEGRAWEEVLGSVLLGFEVSVILVGEGRELISVDALKDGGRD